MTLIISRKRLVVKIVKDGDYVFQQDGAPAHTSKIIHDWMSDCGELDSGADKFSFYEMWRCNPAPPIIYCPIHRPNLRLYY